MSAHGNFIVNSCVVGKLGLCRVWRSAESYLKIRNDAVVVP